MRGVPILIGLAAVVAAGYAAVLWWAEPRITEQAIRVTPHMLSDLKALKGKFTFGPTSDGMYTGVLDPVQRAKASAAFADLVDTLVRELPRHPSKTFVLNEFKRTLAAFDWYDTEDQERATSYCEQIMDVVGIKSSDGVLNGWLYGPILGHMITAHEAAKGAP
jgi:hypothetical protein